MDVQVEEFDSAIKQIVPEKAILEQVATGFIFTEGPVWCGDFLLFSDLRRNRIIRWRMLNEGPEVTTYRSPTGDSNGLALDRSGRLVVCETGLRRMTCTELDGTISVLAERYQGSRLNGPNDVVVRSDGSVYFTDPAFGPKERVNWNELTFSGVYCIKTTGELILLADDFDIPNGLAFSPDESIINKSNAFP